MFKGLSLFPFVLACRYYPSWLMDHHNYNQDPTCKAEHHAAGTLFSLQPFPTSKKKIGRHFKNHLNQFAHYSRVFTKTNNSTIA